MDTKHLNYHPVSLWIVVAVAMTDSYFVLALITVAVCVILFGR